MTMNVATLFYERREQSRELYFELIEKTSM